MPLAQNNKPDQARYKKTWGRIIDELIEVKFRLELLGGFARQTGLPASRAPDDPVRD